MGAKRSIRTRREAITPETVLRVATYTRRSTDDEHQPYTIEAQTQRLSAYVDSQPGWRITAAFTDDASGATLERPGLTTALAAARRGEYDLLLVYRLDRFSRRIRDLATLMDDLDAAGVHFRSATEPFDTTSAAGRLFVQMLGAFAEFEREVIIDRVINGMERKAANGEWTHGPRPYGYLLDRETHRLVPHPDEQNVVRDIFTLYASTRVGTRAIAEQVNAQGKRTRKNKPWSGPTIGRMLASRLYLGEVGFATSRPSTPTPRSSTSSYSRNANGFCEPAAKCSLRGRHPTATTTSPDSSPARSAATSTSAPRPPASCAGTTTTPASPALATAPPAAPPLVSTQTFSTRQSRTR